MYRGLKSGIGISAALLLACSGAWAEAPAPSDPKFFESQVWPIFESRCVTCHGADKQKGKLRLDTPEAINAGGESGPSLVAGKPDESKLYTLVALPKDDPDIMPATGDPLTAEQQGVIKAWIEAGGAFGDWKGAVMAVAAPSASAESAATPAPPSAVKAPDPGILGELAKNVTAATPESVKALSDAGALALAIDRSSPLLSVNFQLAGPAVTDEKLAVLAQAAPQITWLNLANTKVTDAGLAALSGLNNLTNLHLEKTGIGDAGLAHLKGMAHLEYLNVYGTQVTDAGLEILASMPSLKRVYVWQSQVTPEGVEKLRAALPGALVNNGWEAPAEPAPTDAPAETATIDLALLADADRCCAKAKGEGKDCDHPCCVEAKAQNKLCAQCNPEGAKKLAALEKTTADSCCDKAKKAGALCDHDCCKEALAKGELCTKCNAAPADAPAEAPAAEAKFDDNSCCALAKADGKDCDHPCCAEARGAGKVCEKCNPKVASAATPDGAAAPDISVLFDADSCCATAKAGGKECDHPCCIEAKTGGKVCGKCNPKGAAQQNVAANYTPGGCCDAAAKAEKACEHPCCVEAAKSGLLCTACNAKAA